MHNLTCRPMLPLALAVTAGTLAARFAPALSTYIPIAAALCAAALIIFCLQSPKPPAPLPQTTLTQTPPEYLPHILPAPGFIARRGTNIFLLILCAAMFTLAAWRQENWHKTLHPETLPIPQGENEWHTTTLIADAPAEPGRWNIPARALIKDKDKERELPVRLYATSKQKIRRGDKIQTTLRLSAPRPPAFPGAFDSPFWLERDALAAYANTSYRNALTIIPVGNPPLFTRARRVIDAIRTNAIKQTLAYGKRHGAMLAAMLYGYRAELDRTTNEVFRRVGIGHVLAISGLHVGLIAGLVWWVSGRLRASGRVRATICLAAAIVYLGLSGGQTAAARATLMAVIHLGARAAGRRADMLNSLGAAALLIILHNPTAPLDVGFQLSFTAVVFIDIALRHERDHRKIETPEEFHTRLELPAAQRALLRLRSDATSLALLSASTSVGLYPIVATVFHQVNLIGLPINIVVIPMMGAVLAGGLFLPAFGAIPGAAALLTLPSEALTRIAFAADAVPYSSLSVQSPSGWWTAVFYATVFAYILRRMIIAPRPRRRWTRASAAAAAALALIGTIVSMTSLPPPTEPRLAQIPGTGLGTISVEMPDGTIALIGQIRRQGLNETAWLHHLRRSGKTSIVTIGRGKRDTLDAIYFHYPPQAEMNIPLTRKREANAPPVWTPVPEAPGVEFAVRRNDRGRATTLLVRAKGKWGEKTITATTERSGGRSVQPLIAEIQNHVGQNEDQIDRIKENDVIDVSPREFGGDAAGIPEGNDDKK